MTKRRSTGKRLRFAVFARDNFTCRYCGKQSDSVELHIDHIIPISKGGSNDESNLVTSCVPCNLGKSNTLLEQAAPNETDRLRLAQELHEQKQAAKRAKKILKARAARYQDLINFLCESTGQKDFNALTGKILFRYVEQFGEDVVYPWIEKAAERTRTDVSLGQYVSGIRRSFLAEQEGVE